MAIQLSSWRLKSSDDKVTVKVKVSRRGKELGQAQLIYADGSVEMTTYTPRPKRRVPTRLKGIVPVSAGFLAGILLEAFTNFLKLR
jgi:hypothetical protein